MDQATDPGMQAAFDFVIDEQCFQYNQCGNYQGFQNASKDIFQVEYKTGEVLCTGEFDEFQLHQEVQHPRTSDTPWTAGR